MNSPDDNYEFTFKPSRLESVLRSPEAWHDERGVGLGILTFSIVAIAGMMIKLAYDEFFPSKAAENL